MTQILLEGDVGGTKTTLGIFSSDRALNAPLFEATLPSPDYPSLEALVQEFMRQISIPVDNAIFGVAGPVVRGRATITNLPWFVDKDRLAKTLDLSILSLINDLEATAFYVPFLEPVELQTLNEGQQDSKGTVAVIAPGTGLGEAYLVWDGSRYRAYASEGGHADFAPTNAVEMELLAFLQKRSDHVSYEQVCSGRGLPNIYDYFHKDIEPDDKRRPLGKQIAAAADPTPIIVRAALEPEVRCELCVKTLASFVSILGAEAGNLALKVLSTGGVYLGGGIPPRILPAILNGQFMQAFKRKCRMSQLVSKIPVHVIITPRAALLGVAKYGMELSRIEQDEL